MWFQQTADGLKVHTYKGTTVQDALMNLKIILKIRIFFPVQSLTCSISHLLKISDNVLLISQ
jgi:hypothetical protein